MAAGHKNFRLRGGVDENDFPAREISLKDIREVGRIAWEKWGPMIADRPLRDTIGLAYAEGLYHGAMMGPRMIGSNPSGDLSVVVPVSSSVTTEIGTPSVRDLLESL